MEVYMAGIAAGLPGLRLFVRRRRRESKESLTSIDSGV
jgi:hypothetical protein